MADIFSGKGLTLQYNTDTGNRSPQGIGNVTINNVTEFPALTIQSETNNFETYDNEYKTVLLSDKSVEPFDIVVAYLPDDPTHQFLDEMAESQSVFQVIIQYQLDLEESQITYAIVNGYVTGTQLSGDKDQVVTKSYSFTPADVVARVMTMAALLPVYQGDYGVGANTTGVPQYAPVTPSGNSFIKVPSTQAGNPSGADMMGVGLVDGSAVSSLAMTKSGTLSIYAKNATTAWTRIYTATQMDARYVPLTRTVNGKALTADITLNNTDTGSVPVERTVNGHELSDDIVLTKQDIQLENVTNDAQLKISSNLADIDDNEIARTNLDVYSKKEIDSNIDDVNNSINILTTHVNTDFVPKTITVNGHALSSNVTVTKTDLGLGSLAVQNANAVVITGGTATLSTLTLSTALPLTSGGTGASDIDTALINLNAMKFQRTTLGVSDNLNDFNGNNPGFYYCATNVNATTENNYPVNQAGSLVVMRNGANGAFGCTQLFSPYNSNDIYVRTGFAGTSNSWSGWNIILQQGSFGVGAIATLRPADATNSFIADSDGATTWAPANGAGIQSSYANNRLFQFMMTTANTAYMRYNDSGDPQTPKTSKPWTKLLTPGDYGLGADLTVNPSIPISNLNELTPTGFYYTTNESTLGGVTSDTTYSIINRGGRPTATASKYVQQRSWDGFYMGANGWTWKENAYMSALNQGQFRVQANGEAIRMVSTSGQACYIMGMLSDTADTAQRRWYFGNGGADNTVVMYNSRTNNSIGLAAAGNVYIQARSDSTGSGTAYTTQFQSNGTIVGPLGTVTQTSSDIRLKSDIVEAKDGALNRINTIGCVEFTWDNEHRRDRGFIAQQLAEIDDLYTYKPTEEDSYLNYSITALMSDTFGAIQELTVIKDEQARAITLLESKVETLECTIQHQQSQIENLKLLVQSLIDNK
ncbi:TPA: tail fiber domain-containing protein [Escherichia coli]|nr:tail fiber domain-containing protein [Escherichia coli]HAO1992432.1 tail fiber domain-containing protein [Escherichia coli]HAO2025109.1 tail fiber domain-containing protein [Escherichia coli]